MLWHLNQETECSMKRHKSKIEELYYSTENAKLSKLSYLSANGLSGIVRVGSLVDLTSRKLGWQLSDLWDIR